MKKNRIITLLLAATALSMATTASALTLSIDDGFYVGSVSPGGPASEIAEAAYINILIGLDVGSYGIGGQTYNRSNKLASVNFPNADANDAVRNDTGNISSTSLIGYEYILGKYNAGSAGSLVWYIAGGALDAVELPAKYNEKALSHYSGYNPTSPVIPPDIPTVPDSGATVALMGIALAGLGFLKRCNE